MSNTYSLTNPEVYKTYNPNWEPWLTVEEYTAWLEFQNGRGKLTNG